MYHPSLSNFLVIVDYMNISRAAEHLHISQQALSSYVKRLEEYYGEPLFVRKPVLSLTPAGERVLKSAQEIERIYKRLHCELRQDPENAKTVNMGFLRPKLRLYTNCIPAVKYRNRYPDVSLCVLEEYLPQLQEMTLARKLDFYIGVPGSREGLAEEYLLHERYFLTISDKLLKKVFSSEYPDCIKRFEKGVDFEEFLDVPQLAYSESSRISAQCRSFYEENKLTPNIVGVNPNMDLNMQLVMHGAGYTLIPQERHDLTKKNAEQLGCSALHFFPVVRPNLDRPLSIVFRKDENYQPHVIDLMRMIREAAKSTTYTL